MALTKIVPARMNMMRDALPKMAIILRTMYCPVRAATVATAIKYRAAR